MSSLGERGRGASGAASTGWSRRPWSRPSPPIRKQRVAVSAPPSIASLLDPTSRRSPLPSPPRPLKLKAQGVDVDELRGGRARLRYPGLHQGSGQATALDRGDQVHEGQRHRPRCARRSQEELSASPPWRRSTPSNIRVSAGAKHSIYNCHGADRSGRRGHHPGAVLGRIRHGHARRRQAGDRADRAEETSRPRRGRRRRVSPRTRAIVLNNPSNPTGATYTRAQVEALANIAVEKDLLVISDDIYRAARLRRRRVRVDRGVSPRSRARTILVDGVSKTYAMTGWRIGSRARRPRRSSRR